MYLSITISFGCYIVLITIWLIWRKRRMTLLQRYGIPGPKPSFWTGNLKNFNEMKQDCATEWSKEYGNCFGFYLGAKPMLVVNDVELLRIIQIKEFKNFANRDPIFPDAGTGHHAMKESTISIRNKKWKNLRTVLNPAFTSGKIKKMMPAIQSATEVFLNLLAKNENDSFNIAPLFKNLSFDIFGKILFGIEIDVQNKSSSKVVASIYRFFDVNTTDVTSFLSLCFPEIEPIPCMIRSFLDLSRYYLNKPSFRTIVETCEHIIQLRKLHPEERKPDMLQSMIDANIPDESKGSLEDEVFDVSWYKNQSIISDWNADHNNEKPLKRSKNLETTEKRKIFLPNITVIGNAMGFMTAGYEATSLVLGYTIHHLSENPDVQEKLRAEIMEVVGSKEHASYEDLINMKYLDNVFSEVLRLLPVSLTGVTRVTEEEFKYKDLIIPKGVAVIIPIGLLNTNPEYWKEPKKFIPERFSSENKESIDPVRYQPFGVGPRICIGMRFSHVVIKQILTSVLRKYRFHLPEDSKEMEFNCSAFLIKPKHGINIKITAI